MLHEMNLEEAFFFKQLEPIGEDVKRFIYTYVGNKGKMEAIFQETVQVAFKKLQKQDFSASFRSVIFQIAFKQCKQAQRLPIQQRILSNEKQASSSIPFPPVFTQQQKDVKEILELSPMKRAIILLHYIYRFNLTEVSKIVNLKLETAEKQLALVDEKAIAMDQLTKDDFYNFLGNEAYFTKADFDRFIEKNRQQKQTTRIARSKALVGIGALVLLFVAMKLMLENPADNASKKEEQPEEQEETIVEEQGAYQTENQQVELLFSKVNSRKQVDDFFYSTTAGLREAEQAGQVAPSNQTYQLAENVSLTIEKTWSNSIETLVYYSIDVPEEQFVSNEFLTIDFLSEESMNSSIDFFSRFGDELGVVFEGRLYGVLRGSISQEEAPMVKRDELIVTDIFIDYFGRSMEAADVEFPIFFDRKQQHIEKIAINQSLTREDVTFHLESLDLGLSEIIVHGTIEKPANMTVNYIHANLRNLNNSHIFSYDVRYNYRMDNNHVQLLFSPLLSRAEEADVDIHTLDLQSDESMQFSVDVSDYNDIVATKELPYTAKKEEKLFEVKNKALSVHSFVYKESGLDVSFKFDTTGKSKVELIEQIMPAYPFHQEEDIPMTLQTANEKGERVNPSQVDSVYRSSSFVDISYDRAFVEKANTLHFSLSNLLFSYINEVETFRIAIPEEAAAKYPKINKE
ncbi:sigma-70 family RNA polymerase sigma factor [Virgibacillus sp. LDC-1]|uniref:RNA polymerase sigma factor n=1 Tax=Virgibacillus sp. LDC-1 TaxID=3039856 RepID=UPI0024DE1D03|nr:sigma-70 family RNA polymerase sigma factor [Virgibacillus sp. LDC-1]